MKAVKKKVIRKRKKSPTPLQIKKLDDWHRLIDELHRIGDWEVLENKDQSLNADHLLLKAIWVLALVNHHHQCHQPKKVRKNARS